MRPASENRNLDGPARRAAFAGLGVGRGLSKMEGPIMEPWNRGLTQEQVAAEAVRAATARRKLAEDLDRSIRVAAMQDRAEARARRDEGRDD